MTFLMPPLLAFFLVAILSGADLSSARDRQDVAALRAAAADREAAAANKPTEPAIQFQLAQAQSYLAEVLLEIGDKSGAQQAAEAGIRAAESAVKMQGSSSEKHRLLGTWC